jgi:hypothetical protein
LVGLAVRGHDLHDSGLLVTAPRLIGGLVALSQPILSVDALEQSGARKERSDGGKCLDTGFRGGKLGSVASGGTDADHADRLHVWQVAEIADGRP